MIRTPTIAPALEALTSWLLLRRPEASPQAAHEVERILEIAAAALESAAEETDAYRPASAA